MRAIHTASLLLILLILGAAATADPPNLDWSFSPEGPAGEGYVRSLIVTESGGIDAFGSSDYQEYTNWFMTLSSDGQFQHILGISVFVGDELHKAPDGGYVVQGPTIYKLNDDLDVIWQLETPIYYGTINLHPFDDGYYTTGSFDNDSQFVGRISLDGDIEWLNTLADSSAYNVQTLAPVPGDRGVFVAGTSEIDNGENRALFVARISPSGTLLWLRTYAQLPTGILHSVRKLIVRNDGRVLACGEVIGSGGLHWSYTLLTRDGDVVLFRRGMDVRDAALLPDGGVIAAGKGGGMLVRRDARLRAYP